MREEALLKSLLVPQVLGNKVKSPSPAPNLRHQHPKSSSPSTISTNTTKRRRSPSIGLLFDQRKLTFGYNSDPFGLEPYWIGLEWTLDPAPIQSKRITGLQRVSAGRRPRHR